MADALSEVVAEEMRLRQELSVARKELMSKQHTLEILHREKEALEAQRPQALREEIEEVDAEIAELRSQLEAMVGPGATNASAGSTASAASGWGALIHVARAKSLHSPPPVGWCTRLHFIPVCASTARYGCAASARV